MRMAAPRLVGITAVRTYSVKLYSKLDVAVLAQAH
jgi:hypothetical protein